MARAVNLGDKFFRASFHRKAVNLLGSPQELQEYKITASYQCTTNFSSTPLITKISNFAIETFCHRVDQRTCHVLE